MGCGPQYSVAGPAPVRLPYQMREAGECQVAAGVLCGQPLGVD